jgi:carboxy-terminal domain RNA polymerase II polypeptide A small phosphatase
MVTDACTTFIPPQRPEDRGKPVIVLDLDETLIFARDGPVVARPGLAHLFRVMQGRCEVVVWTAGERDYALDAIKRIDPNRCIQHCVYRHRKWWTGLPGYTKDLAALGRPLERTVLIENTPDCTRANPLNSILVKDFHGDCRSHDSTIYQLADIIESIISGCYRRSHISDTLHSHPHVSLREVPCDTNGAVTVFTLAADYHPPVYASTNFDLQRSHRQALSRR